MGIRGLDQSFGMLSQTRIVFAIKVTEGLEALFRRCPSAGWVRDKNRLPVEVGG